jgi:hypothetical protein
MNYVCNLLEKFNEIQSIEELQTAEQENERRKRGGRREREKGGIKKNLKFGEPAPKRFPFRRIQKKVQHRMS